MKIDLPHCEHMVQVLVSSPAGECVKMFDSSHKSFEMELPDGVHEDEVEVLMVRLDECGLAVGEMSYLKEAIVPEPEDEDEDDEEALVEADEALNQSPLDEVVDEEADEEVDADDHDDGRYELGCS